MLRDVLGGISHRGFLAAPPTFAGSLADLFHRFIEPNLIGPAAMADAHRTLSEYCAGKDPLFLVRTLSQQTRGEILCCSAGRIRPTDNSPGWLMHYVLFHGTPLAPAHQLEDWLRLWPCHMFELSKLRVKTVSSAGWHVAHLADVKDRNTEVDRWSKADLERRFVRNIHPCNYTFLPKCDWQRYGSDRRVLGFMAARFRERYSAIWPDFLRLAQIEVDDIPNAFDGERIRYEYSAGTVATGPPSHGPARPTAGKNGAVRYSATRLLFRANIIEALQDDDVFEVETPAGLFRFTKRTFRDAFPGVIQSMSYRVEGVYHFPKVPRAALPFLVE